jgi:hypothetical protein
VLVVDMRRRMRKSFDVESEDGCGCKCVCDGLCDKLRKV